MLGVGTLVGLLVLLVLWGVFYLVSRRRAVEVPEMLGTGPMVPITWILGLLAIFGVVGALIAKDVRPILNSAVRAPFTGAKDFNVAVQPAPDDASQAPPTVLAIRMRGAELRSIRVESPVDLTVRSTAKIADLPALEFEVTGGDTKEWIRAADGAEGLDKVNLNGLELISRGDTPGQVALRIVTSPQHTQAMSIPLTALVVILGYVLYTAIYFGTPKTAAIALATCKSQLSQPLFLILFALGGFLLGLFIFIPYHTFGEDIKVMKDTGMTLIMLAAIIQAVWGASGSVADEIEGRTAMTVLSKPLGRRQFILGKFLGISWASVVLFVGLGLWLLILIAYKPIYDSRETANTPPVWQETHTEMVRAIPGLLLAFLETLVFVAISVAISTRLPLLANISICFSIYAFGHLVPLLVQAGEGKLDTVKFVAQFIATALPVLDHFNIQAAIAAGRDVPMRYLGAATAYCALYCGMALLLALALFEDRDLA